MAYFPLVFRFFVRKHLTGPRTFTALKRLFLFLLDGDIVLSIMNRSRALYLCVINAIDGIKQGLFICLDDSLGGRNVDDGQGHRTMVFVNHLDVHHTCAVKSQG